MKLFNIALSKVIPHHRIPNFRICRVHLREASDVTSTTIGRFDSEQNGSKEMVSGGTVAQKLKTF